MRRYVVDLNIPASELLRYYRGSAAVVIARDRYGRRVRFPAAVLRPFVTTAGVYGRFELEVDAANRLERMVRQRT
ncbi:MAG: DUF2835 domain-containing protein [Pseudomonadales bacterium]